MTFLLFAKHDYDLACIYQQVHNNIEFDFITSLDPLNLCKLIFWEFQINVEL